MSNFTGHYCTHKHKIDHEYNSPPIIVHHFDSMNEGPHLLVLSGIHAGTESIPMIGLETTMQMIHDGVLKLTCGQITFIPLCNPLALEKKKRFVDENLNRVFTKHENPDLYEHYLANILTDYVDRADATIDLHTQSTPSIPFVFDDFPEVSGKLAHDLGISHIVQGWAQAFDDNPNLFNESDTTKYSCDQGKPSVCIECGYNEDPMAASVAMKSVIHAMKHFNLTENVYAPDKIDKHIEIVEGIAMPENAQFIEPFHNFTSVKKGDVLIIDKDTKEPIVNASYDCVLVLPKIWAKPGMEATFLGVMRENI